MIKGPGVVSARPSIVTGSRFATELAQIFDKRIASFLTAAGDNNAGTFVSECQRGGASDSREGSANKASSSSCAPSPMEKALPRRKHNFVR
jgi:hypothetical protein